jgi:hypothetical protein
MRLSQRIGKIPSFMLRWQASDRLRRTRYPEFMNISTAWLAPSDRGLFGSKLAKLWDRVAAGDEGGAGTELMLNPELIDHTWVWRERSGIGWRLCEIEGSRVMPVTLAGRLAQQLGAYSAQDDTTATLLLRAILRIDPTALANPSGLARRADKMSGRPIQWMLQGIMENPVATDTRPVGPSADIVLDRLTLIASLMDAGAAMPSAHDDSFWQQWGLWQSKHFSREDIQSRLPEGFVRMADSHATHVALERGTAAAISRSPGGTRL